MKDEDERGTHRLSPTPMMLLLIQHRAVVDANLCLVCRKHGCIIASDMAYGVYQRLVEGERSTHVQEGAQLDGILFEEFSTNERWRIFRSPLSPFFMSIFLSFVVAHFFSARFLNPAYKRFRWLAPPVLLQLHRMCCT